MSTWKSRGLRGSVLEEMINYTNSEYADNGLALVQKIPTPITPVEMNKSKQITLAYFDQKSTVDYIGTIQGIPVCFDAKECATDTFSLQNIHPHQVEFMRRWEAQDSIAFFLIYFTGIDKFYYLRFRELLTFWDRKENGGRKSFRREELDASYYIENCRGTFIPYLEYVQLDINSRNQLTD